ncbi:BlaI/MecI/CopY family transcriptional regulator [Streptomyces sp. NPDC015139]|uniref:BlaI/MecI/CopY family transcriptional regulator n=1 Tax=Streptomyces sp. NPDC015139 TaxID=3364942 RepID=UPI0036F9591D
MTEGQDETTNLQPLYAARLADDLERNTLTQERLTDELTALEGRLEALRRNHALLVNMQQALGDPGVSVNGAATDHKAPSPVPPQGRSRRNGRSKDNSSVKPAAVKASSAATSEGRGKSSGGPTLRELVVSQVTRKAQPISAQEVTEALVVAHPERNIKITVVRSTLEAMVAKGAVRRDKQGKAVLYSA